MIKTIEQELSCTLYIWATPKWNPLANEFPFDFEVRDSGGHWDDKAIRVSHQLVTVTLPGGIDLYSKALETLDVKERRAMDEYAHKMAIIAEERQQLMLIGRPVNDDNKDYIDHVE
jgi:hypothetical protein